MTYADMLGMYDAHIVNGRHYEVQTRRLAELSPSIITDMLLATHHGLDAVGFVGQRGE